MKKREGWDRGYEDAQKGLSESDNPYDRNNPKEKDLHDRWRSGWYDYMYQDPEMNYCGGY